MRHLLITAAILLALLALVSLVLAQAGQLELPWFTIDGGGATVSTGGRFVLSGTVGQPDAGALSGDVYSLKGGFWEATTGLGGHAGTIYLPLVRR
jgi:hypothetical protein